MKWAFIRLPSANLMGRTKLLVLSCLCLSATYGYAADPMINPQSKDEISMHVVDDKAVGLQLEVRRSPMKQVLDAVSRQTGVPIHYSVLPEGLVSATCVAPSLKPLLECLLNRKADLIVRFRRDAVEQGEQAQIAEAWVLGSKLDSYAKDTPVCPGLENGASVVLTQKNQKETVMAEQLESTLKMAQSGKAEERANAIGMLLSIGSKDDPKVQALLENAIHDKDANVRAQAISTLSHLQGNEALPAIREALLDSSVDVRMMAVDGITDDIGLLQQAVNDSDESIRSLAEVKLQELIQNNTAKP